jgi:3-hydroxyisobutyrate dehydrogenase
MEKIGFIGVGSIGNPMARCLLKAGYELTICDKNPRARERFPENAVKTTDKPSDLALCDVIIVMVASDSQVKEVILGSNGLLSCVNPERPPLLAIMSTILPQTTREVALLLQKKGVRVVDATVTGGPLVAEQGKITIMVGGEKGDFNAMRGIFEVMGEHIYHTGGLGSGDVTKLVNNIIGATNIFLTLEAMLVGKKCGMNPDQLASILKTGSGLNFLTYDWEKGRAFMDFFFKDEDSAKLACEFGRKDLGHALELAVEAGVACPLLDQVVEAVKRCSPEELLEKWRSAK